MRKKFLTSNTIIDIFLVVDPYFKKMKKFYLCVLAINTLYAMEGVSKKKVSLLSQVINQLANSKDLPKTVEPEDVNSQSFGEFYQDGENASKTFSQPHKTIKQRDSNAQHAFAQLSNSQKAAVKEESVAANHLHRIYEEKAEEEARLDMLIDEENKRHNCFCSLI